MSGNQVIIRSAGNAIAGILSFYALATIHRRYFASSSSTSESSDEPSSRQSESRGSETGEMSSNNHSHGGAPEERPSSGHSHGGAANHSHLPEVLGMLITGMGLNVAWNRFCDNYWAKHECPKLGDDGVQDTAHQ